MKARRRAAMELCAKHGTELSTPERVRKVPKTYQAVGDDNQHTKFNA
jgi:hypothetical protein